MISQTIQRTEFRKENKSDYNTDRRAMKYLFVGLERYVLDHEFGGGSLTLGLFAIGCCGLGTRLAQLQLKSMSVQNFAL